MGRAPPRPPPFFRRFFLAGDFSRPGEVTAAPGKPIAPSGEPDKLMPLLKSVEHHPPREVLSMCDSRGRRPQAIFGRVRRAHLAGRRAQLD